MFEKEEVKQEFEKWLAERQKLQFNKTNDNKNSPVETIGTPQENTQRRFAVNRKTVQGLAI